MVPSVQFDHQPSFEQQIHVADAVHQDLRLHADARLPEPRPRQRLKHGIGTAVHPHQYLPGPAVPAPREAFTEESDGHVPSLYRAFHHDQGMMGRQAAQSVDQYVAERRHRPKRVRSKQQPAVLDRAGGGTPPVVNMRIRGSLHGPQRIERGRQPVSRGAGRRRQFPAGPASVAGPLRRNARAHQRCPSTHDAASSRPQACSEWPMWTTRVTRGRFLPGNRLRGRGFPRIRSSRIRKRLPHVTARSGVAAFGAASPSRAGPEPVRCLRRPAAAPGCPSPAGTGGRPRGPGFRRRRPRGRHRPRPGP